MSEDQSVNKESSRGLRKERVGVVSSDSMDKTIVVSVVTRVPHERFRKIVKKTTKLYAHTKPVSKNKCWRLVEVLSH